MKKLLFILLPSFLFASCAMPLEQLVEQQRQERIDAANAQRPVAQGATDSMGSYIVENAGHLTLQTASDRTGKNP